MKNLEDIKILVVGDIMLDKYTVGSVERISPEAPVPVVNVIDEYTALGGCGNVVRNLRSIGVQVDCLASIAPDENGKIVGDRLDLTGARSLLFYGSKVTTVKERIISDQRQVQMLRIDREIKKSIDHMLSLDYFIRINCGRRPDYDMVIISDYAKGLISYDLIKFFKDEGYKIIVDPKPENGYIYNGVYMITPNEKEWNVMKLSSQYTLKNVQYVLETKGKDGMILHDFNTGQDWPIKSDPVDVYNVSGAGDTVVAVMSLCISMGFEMFQSAVIANTCAAHVVTQPGTSTVPREVFDDALEAFRG